MGTTYSPVGTAKNPTAITVPDVAAPDRPQTPETPDGTGELRRALREGSAGTDFRGWTRSSLFDSEDPLLGLFARVQPISHILQASVTFVAGPPGTMTVVAVHHPPLLQRSSSSRTSNSRRPFRKLLSSPLFQFLCTLSS